MRKCKAPMPQGPSAVVDDGCGKEEHIVPSMNDIDSDECSDLMAADDKINETNGSEWEDGGNDIHEWFHGEIPSLDVLDPVDPVDRVQGTESVDDSPIYPNARITNVERGNFLANRITFCLPGTPMEYQFLNLLSIASGLCTWQSMNFLSTSDGAAIILYWQVYGLAP